MNYYSDQLPKTHYLEIFQSSSIERSETKDAQLYHPSGKGSIKRTKSAVNEGKFNYITQIPGTEFLADKKMLWVCGVRALGRSKVLEYLPETWLLTNPKDLAFISNLATSNPFHPILIKGNKQKRKSIKVINLYDLHSHLESDYIIAQRIIACSKRFTDRPFHIRIYLIATCREGNVKLQFCQEGKIIYGESGNTITDNQTELPEGLPLFISELNKDSHGLDSNYIKNQLSNILPLMMDSIATYTDQNKDSKMNMAQLLGLDLIIDTEGKLKVLEVNIRPEMKGGSSKDTSIKKEIVHDHINHFLLNKNNPLQNWVQV